MELYQLKSFVVVAREGHLTRAAEKLFISQPAVSGHIKALEAELGVRLFQRSAKGMALTPEGARLLENAQAVLQGADAMALAAQAMQDKLSGPFRLGLNTDSSFPRVSRLFRAIHDSHPGIELELVQSTSFQIIDALKRGGLDGGFLFVNDPDPDLDMIELEQVSVHIAGPASWAERIHGATLEELAAMPWVWTGVDCPCNHLAKTLFQARGGMPSPVAITDSDGTRRDLVVSGTGLAMMHANEVGPLLKEGRIAVWEQDFLSLPGCFAWHRPRTDDPLVRAVREAVASVWDEDQQD